MAGGAPDQMQGPPNYEEAAHTSRSQPTFPGDSKRPLPNVRYLYYQIFDDGMTSPVKQRAPDTDEPSIGRIRARDIAPPRSVGVIKRAIAKAEDIDVSCISGIYLLAGGSGEAADGNMRLDILDERGRGPRGSPDVPIAIVLGMQTEEVASVTMSKTEPGRVTDNKRPKGWKLGKTRGHNAYLCLAIKPTRSGLRWLDGTLEPGKRIFVDTSNLVNLTDWNKTYAMYPVIFQDTRNYGFMPADSIELEPEPQSSRGKGKLPSFNFKDLFSSN